MLTAPDILSLCFPTAAPKPEQVIVQAIGPKAEDYQIRNLATRAGGDASTLLASGKIKDAAYVRVTLNRDGNQHVRSVPLVRAT